MLSFVRENNFEVHECIIGYSATTLFKALFALSEANISNKGRDIIWIERFFKKMLYIEG